VFVRRSIEAVVHTLFEAILLVVLVVILFLQTWRASIIPLAAVPVSLVGTFAAMLALGFSINALSLFAWSWPIGIGWTTPSLSWKTSSETSRLVCRPSTPPNALMNEVTGPIVATALVLCAVFCADGIHQRSHGPVLQTVCHHHRHFTVISAFNSLTARGVVRRVAQGPPPRKDWFARMMDRSIGWLFRPIQPGVRLDWRKYATGVGV